MEVDSVLPADPEAPSNAKVTVARPRRCGPLRSWLLMEQLRDGTLVPQHQDRAGSAPHTSAVHSVRRMTPPRANPADARARECSPRDRPGRAVRTLRHARTEADQRHVNQRPGRSLRCPSRADQVFILPIMSCSTTKPNGYMTPISACDPHSSSPASMNSTADTRLDRKPALRLTSRTWPLRVFRWHPRLIQQPRLQDDSGQAGGRWVGGVAGLVAVWTGLAGAAGPVPICEYGRR
jgi:hypothetical protein